MFTALRFFDGSGNAFTGVIPQAWADSGIVRLVRFPFSTIQFIHLPAEGMQPLAKGHHKNAGVGDCTAPPSGRSDHRLFVIRGAIACRGRSSKLCGVPAQKPMEAALMSNCRQGASNTRNDCQRRNTNMNFVALLRCRNPQKRR